MESPKTELCPEQLTEVAWDSRLARYEAARKPKAGKFERYAVIIGLIVPFLLYFGGFKMMAMVAATVFLIVTFGSLGSKVFKSNLQKAAQWLSGKVGILVTWITLAPIYLIGFTFVRFLQWVGGEDRMLLRNDMGKRSMWQDAEVMRRKAAAEMNMFCAEKLQTRGFGLAKWAVMAFLILLIGEGFLRFKGYHKPLLYMNDVYAGYRIQPNQHVRWEGGEVFINNHGMRNRYDVKEAKPANTFRILLIGDSTLYGNDDLPQDVIYSARLEKALTGLVPGRRVEVLNMGVNGAGPHQNYGMLRRYPHAFQSDLVIGCFPLGDVYRAKQDMTLSRWQMNRPRLAWETAVIYYLPKLRASLNNRDTFKNVENANYDLRELSEDGVQTYGLLATSAKTAGSEVWFELLPQIHEGVDADAGEIYSEDYKQRFNYLSSFLAKDGVKVYLPLDIFKGKGKTHDVWHDPAHLGVKGHEIYAEYLQRQIMNHSAAWKAFQEMSEGGQR